MTDPIDYDPLFALIAEAQTAVGATWVVSGTVGQSHHVPDTGGTRATTQEYVLTAEKVGSAPAHVDAASSVANLVAACERYDA